MENENRDECFEHAYCFIPDKMIDWRILEFDELESTHSYAREMLERGDARHGHVYHAWHQTKGRGRFPERAWFDTEKESLLVSFVLQTVARELIDLVPHLAAIATLDAIRTITRLR